MTARTPARARNSARRPSAGALAAAAQISARRTRRRNYKLAASAGVLAVLAVLVTVGLLTSRPTSSNARRLAPGFSLPTTAGTTVTLGDYRGRSVVLYFNEGAGCGSCTMQLSAIEKQQKAFDDAGIVVLPIVMNTKEQIQPDLDQYQVKTPVLLDDGKVSRAYNTLGKGMHEGLPGHSFVLIDAQGNQRWFGEYPSMWLEPSKLLAEISARLA